MGISNVMVHWLDDLENQKLFYKKSSILELGPQDLVVSKPVLENFIRKKTKNYEIRNDFRDSFYNTTNEFKPNAAKIFYLYLGLKDYYSLDLDDPRANFREDLNKEFNLNTKFDIITNFGTLEHVHNIGLAAKCIHTHLKIEGIALHVMPARGDYNHGFYNIHSTWYRDLAAANNYRILDLRYIPDFGGQHEKIERLEKIGDSAKKSIMLDIKHNDQKNESGTFAIACFKYFIKDLFHKNKKTRVFDYIFAALQKTSESAFINPQQSYYLNLKKSK